MYWLGRSLTTVLKHFGRGLCLAVSAALYPVTRRLYDPAWTRVDNHYDPNSQSQQQPNYSRTVEEFIGVSVQWRVSADTGYEFRIGYWHYYAPTVVSIWRGLTDAGTRMIPVGLAAALMRRPPTAAAVQLPAWLARHSATLGLSTSAPLPDPPHVACTGLLSLSGFYFRDKASSKKTSSTTTGSTAASTSTAATTSTTSAAAVDSDSESTPKVLADKNVSSKNNKNRNKKKNVLLTASTATITTTKSPWQLLREKESAIAALALESALPDKKKDQQDDDDGQKKKKSSNSSKKQPSLQSTSSAFL